MHDIEQNPVTPLPARENPQRSPKRATPRSIPEQIAEEIGAAIIAGRHAVGERLIENDLAQTFGVSRGPIRETLRILERRRMIELLPRRGAYVREVSLNSIADLFNTRIALSTQAARTMALIRPADFIETLRRRVEELHQLAATDDASPQDIAYVTTRAVRTIARGSGNDLLVEVIADLAEQTVWTTIWKSPLDYLTPASRRDSAQRMAEVLQAIEHGKASEAERKLRIALELDRDQAIAQLSKLRDEQCDPNRLLRTAG